VIGRVALAAFALAACTQPEGVDPAADAEPSDAAPADAAPQGDAAVDVSTDAAAPIGPTVLRAFDGDTGQPGAYKDHPDMGVAASGAQVVEVTGQSVVVYDYAGKTLAKSTMSAFLTSAGLTPGTINDPRVVFDPFVSRFVVVCSCSNDFVVVSGSADATQPWRGVALGVRSGDLTMFPGYDKNGVYIAEYGGSTASYDVVALPSADVAWTGSGNVSLLHANVLSNFPYETRPAEDPDPNKQPGDPAWFVARNGPPQNGTNVALSVLVDSLTWSGAVANKGTQLVLPTGYVYNTPVDARQSSGPMLRGAESHRFMSAQASGGHLYAVLGSGPCTSGCGAQGANAHQLFFWFDVDTGSRILSQEGKVASASEDYLFPSLSADSSGNVGIVATASSATEDPSVALFAHHAGDAPGSVGPRVVASAGTHAYSCNATDPVGWGDYSTTARDPLDPTALWAVEEYGADATPCVWQTRIVEFRP